MHFESNRVLDLTLTQHDHRVTGSVKHTFLGQFFGGDHALGREFGNPVQVDLR